MTNDLENIIYSEDVIRQRVAELGARISSDYGEETPLIIGILKGSFVFLADLARCINTACEIRFLSASSYGYGATTSGKVKISQELDFDVKDRDVLIVEDILDTGVTLKSIIGYIEKHAPKSVRVCALLDKKARREVPLEADYVGFDCPDVFIVGYGLDYAERYRNLPYIAALKPEIYTVKEVVSR